MGKRKRSRKVYGQSAHYWRPEMTPLLLVADCVDIAVECSKEASVIYQQIIDAWDRPDCRRALKDNIAIPIAEIEAWEKAVTGKNKYEPGFDVWTDLYKRYRKSDDFKYLFNRISEFIKVGFNRKSDIAKGNYKVVASNAICLCFAVGFWTGGSYLEKQTDWDGEKQLKLGDKVLSVSPVTDGVASERLHRLHTKMFKRYGYNLSHDGTLKDAGWYWYQSRVVYSGPEEFCRQYYDKEGVWLEPRNVNRIILGCDIATGYPRRGLVQADE